MGRFGRDLARIERLACLVPVDRRSLLTDDQRRQLDPILAAVLRLDPVEAYRATLAGTMALPEDIARTLTGPDWIEPWDSAATAAHKYRAFITERSRPRAGSRALGDR